MCNKKEFLLLFFLSVVCVFLETTNYGMILPWYIWALPMMVSWFSRKVALFFLVATQLFSLNPDAPINSTILFSLIYGVSLISKISNNSLRNCFQIGKLIWIYLAIICL